NTFVKLQEQLASNAPQTEINDQITKLEKTISGFYKDYNAPTDKKVFAALLSLYYNNIDQKMHPAAFATVRSKYQGDFTNYADEVFAKSLFTSEAGVRKALADVKAGKKDALKNDPALQLASSITEHHSKNIMPTYTQVNDNLNLLYRSYMAGLREMQ